MPKEIKFQTTKEDRELILKIVDRTVKVAIEARVDYKRGDCEMDLIATHLNGCALKLQKLLTSDDFDFSHDVFGIRRHLDRKTGELSNHFLPRCAR